MKIGWMIALLVATCNAVASESKPGSAQEFFTRASQVGSLEAAAKGQYRIEYHFKLSGFAARELEGTYSRLWTSADRFREEISLPGFSETVVVNGKKMWITRSLPYEPDVFVWLRRAMNPTLKIGADETVHKIREEKEGGEQLQCVELRGKSNFERTLCFNQPTGYLVMLAVPDHHFEYTNFGKVASSSIPRTVRTFDGNRLEGYAELVALTAQPSPGDSQFERPAGSEEWATCENPIPPKLLHARTPDYPSIARSARLQGSVTLRGVIESDGTVKSPMVIESRSEVFNKPAIDVVKDSRYTPETCDGTPIPAETVITVNFTLSYQP